MISLYNKKKISQMCVVAAVTAAVTASTPTQESPIRAGFSFTPTYCLLLTGRQYVIPFTLRQEDVLVPLVEALNRTADLRFNVDHVSTDYPLVAQIKITLDHFDREFHSLFNDLNKFLHYVMGSEPSLSHPLQMSRQKRGWVNALGSLSNVLFGTATQGQVDAIYQRLHELSSLSEEERVLLNVHSETLNLTLRNMVAMHSALHRLDTVVKVSNQVLRQFSIRTLEIKGKQRLFQALLNLEIALMHISTDVLNLKIGLQALLQTYISPTIITNQGLLAILREAASRSPGLQFPALSDYLSLYRSLMRSSSKPTVIAVTRNFYLTLPL